MFSEFAIRGKWFLPGNQQNAIEGNLSYKEGIRIELDTLGKFSKNNDDAKIILGICTDGKLYTLLYNQCISWTQHSSGMSTSIFRVDKLIVGGHYSDLKEILFDRMYCQYNLLEEWIGFKAFEINENFVAKKLSIEYNHYEPIEFSINEKTTGKIHFNRTGLTRNFIQKEIHSTYFNYVEFAFENPQTIESLIQYQFTFQRFLTLGVNENIYPKSIEINNSEKFSKPQSNHQLCYIPSGYHKSIVQKKITRFMFFTYSDISDGFSSIVQSWYNKSNKLQIVFNLLFDNLYARHRFDSFMFLSAIQGLETFHRYQNPTSDFEIERHENRIKSISENLKNDDKEWISQKLQYAFEPSLRKRLREIITAHKTEVLGKLIGKEKTFIEIVVNERNFYTHFDKRLEPKKLEINELMRITGILELLLSTCILKESGFGNDLLEKIHKNSKIIRHLVAPRN